MHACTGQPRQRPPTAMPVLLDVVQQLLIFLLSPGPLLEAILVAARRPPHGRPPEPALALHRPDLDRSIDSNHRIAS